MPGPKRKAGLLEGWLLGYVREVTNVNPIHHHLEWVKDYGKMVRVNVHFNTPRVLCMDPVATKRVLVDNATNYVRPDLDSNLMNYVMGCTNLLTAEGDVHTRLRSAMKPAFTPKSVRRYGPIIQKHASILADAWTMLLQESSQAFLEMDVTELLSRAKFDTVLDVAFSYDAHSVQNFLENSLEVSPVQTPEQETDWHAINKNLLLVSELSPVQLLPTWIRENIFWRQRTRDYRNARQNLDNLMEGIIADRLRKVQADEDITSPSETIDPSDLDLLSHMIKSQAKSGCPLLSLEELKSNCHTMLVAGHDTTMNAMTWTLHALSQHPEVQARLRDEIRSHHDAPNPHPIEDLPYLDAVVRESLRVHTVAPINRRMALHDDVLAGYMIPAGTVLWLSPGATHLDDETFIDAAEFRPERWLEWSGPSGKDRLMYLPFGAGRRDCVGRRLATLEMKIVISTLVSQFEVEPVPGFEVSPQVQITSRPSNGLRLKISKVL